MLTDTIKALGDQMLAEATRDAADIELMAGSSSSSTYIAAVSMLYSRSVKATAHTNATAVKQAFPESNSLKTSTYSCRQSLLTVMALLQQKA